MKVCVLQWNDYQLLSIIVMGGITRIFPRYKYSVLNIILNVIKLMGVFICWNILNIINEKKLYLLYFYILLISNTIYILQQLYQPFDWMVLSHAARKIIFNVIVFMFTY